MPVRVVVPLLGALVATAVSVLILSREPSGVTSEILEKEKTHLHTYPSSFPNTTIHNEVYQGHKGNLEKLKPAPRNTYMPSMDDSIRPAMCVIRAWCKTPTLPVTPAQLKRPGIGRNASCALSDCSTSRP